MKKLLLGLIALLTFIGVKAESEITEEVLYNQERIMKETIEGYHFKNHVYPFKRVQVTETTDEETYTHIDYYVNNFQRDEDYYNYACSNSAEFVLTAKYDHNRKMLKDIGHPFYSVRKDGVYPFYHGEYTSKEDGSHLYDVYGMYWDNHTDLSDWEDQEYWTNCYNNSEEVN